MRTLHVSVTRHATDLDDPASDTSQVQDTAIMDDSRTQHPEHARRTQRTLDALADLYLTGPDGPKQVAVPAAAPAASVASSSNTTHSAANTGPRDSAPLRLPPKLRIRQAPSPSPAPTFSTPAADSSTGPARPWREVRQERRDQFAAAQDDAADGFDADPSVNPSTDHEQGDAHGALPMHMQQASRHEPTAWHKTPAPAEAHDDDSDNGDIHDNDHNHVDLARDHDDDGSHQPYAFPAAATRSRDIAASGVMTDEADGPRVGEPQSTPVCQAVFLGNLPGFAGPWLAQYAQLLAVKRQRVAIVHVNDGLAEVELVSPLGVARVEPARQGESIIDLFERLTRDPQSPLTHWLVHLPLPLNADSVELGHDFDHWTLLTGADDAAAASGVQWLKRMLVDDRRAAFRHVGVSVMGSDPQRGQAVVDKLNTEGKALLARPVTARASRRQMAPVNAQSIGVFAPVMEIWAELVAYLTDDALHEVAPNTPDEGASVQAPLRSAVADTGDDTFSIPQNRRVSPQRQSPAQQKAMAGVTHDQVQHAASDQSQQAQPAQPTLQTPAASATAGVAQDVQTHTQVHEHEPVREQQAASVDADSLDFVRWITPGAIALDARCPYKPAIQLALDQQGKVHVMAGPSSVGSDGAEPFTRPRDLAMDLLEARQWAADHIKLLALTLRQCRFDFDAQPVVHLFTTDGPAAAAMTRTMNDSIKLHLLQQAHIGSQSTWVASPLN